MLAVRHVTLTLGEWRNMAFARVGRPLIQSMIQPAETASEGGRA